MELTVQVVAPESAITPQLSAGLLETRVAAMNAGASAGCTSPASGSPSYYHAQVSRMR